MFCANTYEEVRYRQTWDLVGRKIGRLLSLCLARLIPIATGPIIGLEVIGNNLAYPTQEKTIITLGSARSLQERRDYVLRHL